MCRASLQKYQKKLQMRICSHQTFFGRNKHPVLRAKGIQKGKVVKLKLRFSPVEVSEKVRVQDAIFVKPLLEI